MQIISDHIRDTRSAKTRPGAYEWWYFDGNSDDGVHSFVIIFYEGNPFSTRYIRELENRDRPDSTVEAADHPAVSISVYEDRKPVYYSFTEFDRKNAVFDEEKAELKVGGHSMRGTVESGLLKYQLNLKERLPSGDRIVGHLTFTSPVPADSLLKENEEPTGHRWNLVQPMARVEGALRIGARGEAYREIGFQGTGYHDHNTGDEPMRDGFNEWYWGRFHFGIGTLIYYIMERKNNRQSGAWLISPEHSWVMQSFTDIELQDPGWSKFGMKSARKLLLGNDAAHVTIQQSRMLDDGPFYQRFDSDAFINIPEQDVMQVAEGISEYIRPGRIYMRMFWPLMNMRIRYEKESPHWVQRSKTLYRWTW